MLMAGMRRSDNTGGYALFILGCAPDNLWRLDTLRNLRMILKWYREYSIVPDLSCLDITVLTVAVVKLDSAGCHWIKQFDKDALIGAKNYCRGIVGVGADFGIGDADLRIALGHQDFRLQPRQITAGVPQLGPFVSQHSFNRHATSVRQRRDGPFQTAHRTELPARRQPFKVARMSSIGKST